jgi:hypothetical protein
VGGAKGMSLSRLIHVHGILDCVPQAGSHAGLSSARGLPVHHKPSGEYESCRLVAHADVPVWTLVELC